MGECLHGARIVSLLPLQLLEHIDMLKIWIPLVLGWTAEAYFPSESVVRQMIYRVALKLHSLGLFFPTLSQVPERGVFP